MRVRRSTIFEFTAPLCATTRARRRHRHVDGVDGDLDRPGGEVAVGHLLHALADLTSTEPLDGQDPMDDVHRREDRQQGDIVLVAPPGLDRTCEARAPLPLVGGVGGRPRGAREEAEDPVVLAPQDAAVRKRLEQRLSGRATQPGDELLRGTFLGGDLLERADEHRMLGRGSAGRADDRATHRPRWLVDPDPAAEGELGQQGAAERGVAVGAGREPARVVVEQEQGEVFRQESHVGTLSMAGSTSCRTRSRRRSRYR
jgi:hypothetical protein